MGVVFKMTVFLAVCIQWCSRHLSGCVLMGAVWNLLAEMQAVGM